MNSKFTKPSTKQSLLIYIINVKLILLTLLLSSAASSFFCRFSSEGSFLWAARYRLWGLSGDRSVGLFRMISKAWPDVRLFRDFTSISTERNQQSDVTRCYAFDFTLYSSLYGSMFLFIYFFYFSLVAHWYCRRTCPNWFSLADISLGIHSKVINQE